MNSHGNAIVDELGRIVMRDDYDLLGNRIHLPLELRRKAEHTNSGATSP
jgi:hypothetical protein